MKTLNITSKEVKETKYYYKEYIGEDVSDFEGNIEIEENLGCVRFSSIKANGYIWAKEGSEIEAGRGIEAGLGIKAGSEIEAGEGIKAGEGITCKKELTFRYKLFAGTCLWKTLTDAEKTITCGKLNPIDGAKVEYGIVKEIGIED